MLKINNLSVSPEKDSRKTLYRLAAEKIGVGAEEIGQMVILRRSIDARKKSSVRLIYSVAVSLRDERDIAGFGQYEEGKGFSLPMPECFPSERPVIVGFGPAGMFAALALAEAGLKPLIIERGSNVDTRSKKVEHFTLTGELDSECNVQFGEGGAGTFSDGKLNTGINESSVGWILSRFAEFGAGVRVTYDAAPHVGTDVLKNVVRNIRNHILSLGGEIRFDTRLIDFRVINGTVRQISIESKDRREQIPCSTLFLAVGHSARDTLQLLYDKGIAMEAKPFAMGVRIEHKQKEIDRVQYGSFAGNRNLGAAPYKLSVHLPDGTGVYTFCMCPGGYVMAAASETGGIVTNGMSYSGRAGENANSALLVSLNPERFPYSGPLGGMLWQREIERRAFVYAGSDYRAPCQLTGDFLAGKSSAAFGSVAPTYRPGVRLGSLDEVLPELIVRSMRAALPALDRRLPGFASPDAVLTAPETRSSSPVRLLRGPDLQSLSVKGLYPCGEGAGWAGGIVSAASDALRCCERYILSLKKN